MIILRSFDPSQMPGKNIQPPRPENVARLNGRQVFQKFQAEYLPKLNNLLSQKLSELLVQHGKTNYDIEMKIIPQLHLEIQKIKQTISSWLVQQSIDPLYQLDCTSDALWDQLNHKLLKEKHPLSNLTIESASHDLDFVDYVTSHKD